MANSRLFIYDKETDSAVMIARTMGSGWYGYNATQNRFFDNLDTNRGWGMPESTDLKLVTEHELPSGCNIYWWLPSEKNTMSEPEDDEKEECDHNWGWIDDSFDHEFGTEVLGHWECEHCDEEREGQV